MDSLEKLKLAIIAQVKANVPVQSLWAECSSVNMEDGTMVAVRDGLEYENVLLGLGPDITAPEVGSKVLLGIIENKGVATFLIFADKVAIRRINGDVFGGLVKVQELADQVNELKQELNALKTVFGSWITVPNDGGAALKAGASTWAGQQLVPVTIQELQNPKVSHG